MGLGFRVVGICRNHQGRMGVPIKEHVGDYFEKLNYCPYFLHNSMDMGSLSGSIFRIRFRTIPKCKRDHYVRCSGSQHEAHVARMSMGVSQRGRPLMDMCSLSGATFGTTVKYKRSPYVHCSCPLSSCPYVYASFSKKETLKYRRDL